MKANEKAEAIAAIMLRLRTKGIPIDCRDSDERLAKYIGKILDEELEEDTPAGVIDAIEYDLCPKCNAVVGFSANYCKKCGQLIRERKFT